jgi:hypothetical protein
MVDIFARIVVIRRATPKTDAGWLGGAKGAGDAVLAA